VSGICSLWRYPDDEFGFGEPTTIYPDHFGARVVATAVVAALLRARRTGQGCYIEGAQAEMIVNQLADVFAATALGVPGVGVARGNESDRGVPWSIYPCAGDDEWCVITVEADSDWRALCRVLGDPDWTSDAALDTAAGRRAARDVVDANISRWTAARTPHEVAELLQANGVPAAMMLRPTDHDHDPHLSQRGIYREFDQQGIGPIRTEDGPFRSRNVPPVRVGPAPLFGEHTRMIAADVLGLDDAEIERLVESGVLEVSSGAPVVTG
jgi:crotonobetainyl-CoA:carnitine CoA-transferase CaiB-like acyl-CoA transferase